MWDFAGFLYPSGQLGNRVEGPHCTSYNAKGGWITFDRKVGTYIDHSTVKQGPYQGGAACAGAAGGGHIPVLEWLRKKGAKWDARACAEAAMHGHLDCLRWLVDNKCPQDITTFYWGVRYACMERGSMKVLKYLVGQDCPWCTSPWSGEDGDEDSVWPIAASKGSVELVQWLYETDISQFVPWTVKAGYAAARAGRLDNLQFMYEHGPSLVDPAGCMWDSAVSDSDWG